MTDHLLDPSTTTDIGPVALLGRWPRPAPRVAALGAPAGAAQVLPRILGQLDLWCTGPVDVDAGAQDVGGGAPQVARRRAFDAARRLRAPVGIGVDGSVVVLADLEAGLVITGCSTDLCSSARDVVDAARRRCPRCDRRGFGVDRHEGGLPCLVCGTPTCEVLAEVRRCDGCDHEQAVRAPLDADPAACSRCHP